jgi:hypothetical protein
MENQYSHTHIVKNPDGSEVKRFDVKTREDKINISEKFVEAGDLTSEMIKHYNKSLWLAVKDHRNLGLKKLYFGVLVKRNPTDHNKFHVKILPFRQELDKLYENMDFYVYDYEKEEMKWLWSVPHKFMMKNYLKDESKYDKKLIYFIKKFLKQENLDLNDFKPSKIIKLT